jgi:asparaginyl-tRNA synthetase
MKKDMIDKETFEMLETLPPESTIEIEGVVRKDSRAPGGYEVSITKARMLRRAEENFPIAQKYHGPEFLLDNRHLWIRNRKMQATLRIRASVLDAAREWFKENGYTETQVPTIITAACEGGSTLFEVKYFDSKAYLTQSWQLYAEAIIASLGRIYTIAPSFRAERSRTRRHLTEYWHLEAEAPWYNLESLMKDEEELLTHIVHSVAKSRPNELALNKRQSSELLNLATPFPRITYDKAVELLQKRGVEITYGDDLGWEQERVLTLQFDTPFFVTHFPKTAKAFYHKLDPSNPELTLSADLLAPEGYGEITGGGERIEDLEELTQRIRDEKLDPKSYQWYLDLRRYGTVPHAGFGLGVERTIAWICKLKHIRDAVAFPRLINRVYP